MKRKTSRKVGRKTAKRSTARKTSKRKVSRKSTAKRSTSRKAGRKTAKRSVSRKRSTSRTTRRKRRQFQNQRGYNASHFFLKNYINFQINLKTMKDNSTKIYRKWWFWIIVYVGIIIINNLLVAIVSGKSPFIDLIGIITSLLFFPAGIILLFAFLFEMSGKSSNILNQGSTLGFFYFSLYILYIFNFSSNTNSFQ